MNDKLQSYSDLISAIRREGQVLIVSIRGEVDLNNSPELRTELLDMVQKAKPAKVILNLQQVPYMDSSAIAVLVELLQRVRRTGGNIILTDLQPRVKGLLEIARLDTIFGVAPDEKTALGM